MSTHYQDVDDFNTKFGLLRADQPQHLTQRKLQERLECMREELGEFAEACGLAYVLEPEDNRIEHVYSQGELADQADALVDLVYFAIGTAVMLGLPWQALWDDVQRANLSKVPGPTKRVGHRRDLMKPPGWEGPRTEAILAASGYERRTYTGDNDDIVEELCHDDL